MGLDALKNPLREKTNFTGQFNPFCSFKPLRENISLFQNRESAVSSARPVSTRGALRDRHGRWKRDAMDAAVCETSTPTRTAKSRGPDLPTLGSSPG
jgi:hypothetical protein